jgi:hypothetical protein
MKEKQSSESKRTSSNSRVQVCKYLFSILLYQKEKKFLQQQNQTASPESFFDQKIQL